MKAKAEVQPYKYGTCPVCGHGLWRDGKCFLFQFHGQEASQVEVAPGQMTIDSQAQLEMEIRV